MHWEKLSPSYPGIERIAVIGMDITKRAKSPVKMKTQNTGIVK